MNYKKLEKINRKINKKKKLFKKESKLVHLIKGKLIKNRVFY